MIKAILILSIVNLLGLGGLGYFVYWAALQIKLAVAEHGMKTVNDLFRIQLDTMKVSTAEYHDLKASLNAKTELLINTQGELAQELRTTIVEIGKVVVAHSDTVKAHSQALLDSAHTNHVAPRRAVTR